MHVDIYSCNALHQVYLTTWKVQLQHTCTSAGRRHTQIPHVPIGPKSIVRLLIMEITNNCYKHVKIKNQFHIWTQCAPVKLPAMVAQSPKGEWPMTAGFIVIRRRSTGPPAVTSGPPFDCHWDIGGVSAENFVICRENRPVAEQSSRSGRQATTGWLYDIVQGQENRLTSYRSCKVGIRQKSSGHSQDLCFLGTSA